MITNPRLIFIEKKATENQTQFHLFSSFDIGVGRWAFDIDEAK
jgi:hypothetical protein